jgi:hypothetical protein
MAYVASRNGAQPVVVQDHVGLRLRQQTGWRLLRPATEAETAALGDDREQPLSIIEARVAAAPAASSIIVVTSQSTLPLPDAADRRRRRP